MNRIYYILIILFPFILSCNTKNQNGLENKLENLIIHEKIFSPDSTKYLIRFSYDEGAFGSCCNQTSILKITDSLSSLNEYILPSVFNNPLWISESEIRVDIHMLQLLRASGNFDPAYPELNKKKINGIEIQKNYFNRITNKDSKQIKFSKTSPNNEYELVGYEYKSSEYIEDSVLHISVVPKGESLPYYGNLYIISSRMYSAIKSINWKTNDSLIVKIREKNNNYGQIEFCEINKTANYQFIISNIKKVIEYE